MSGLLIGDAFTGIIPTAKGASDGYEPFRVEGHFALIAVLATTAALAEQPIFIARRKMRVIGLKLAIGGVAITGAATNFCSLVIAVRHAAAPATQKIIATYNASTDPAGSIAAFASRDLFLADLNGSAADADFILAPGDVVTATVTKTGTGMSFPISTTTVVCEARD